jgi:hypothetical protein
MADIAWTTFMKAFVRRWKGLCRHFLFVPLCLALTGAAAPEPAGFLGTAAWKQDFAQLQAAMADHYANLEWAVERRGVDLPKLAAATNARLEAAHTNGEARAAFAAFLKAFGDGHLGIGWPSSGTSSGAPPPRAEPVSAVPACAAYRPGQRYPGIDFRRFGGFRPVETSSSRYFPATVFDAAGYGKVGVIQIDLFDEHRFPELCEQAAQALHVATGPCGDGCAGPLERETANLLTRRLEEQIEALKRRGIRALVVDISNNGGGSNWVGPAVRVFTARRLFESRQGFVRHPHWVSQLSGRLSEVEADLKTADPKDRPLLDRAVATYRAALADAGTSCRRDGLWKGEKLSCSLVSTAGPLYAAGILRYAPPGSLPPNLSCCYLFGPQRYRYREGVYTGPLFVIVDRETASAAEYFAAVLQDNKAATIVGEPTYGAGCGYTNGGIETHLHNSGGDVRMPDCVRFRADGSNEVEGITPDLLVPWRANDSDVQRSRRLEKVLSDYLARPVPRR